jgi:hypothetical protein
VIDIALAVLIRATINGTEGTIKVSPSTQLRTGKITDHLPRVVYTLVNEERDYCDEGSTGLPLANYQLDIFDSKMSEARALSRLIRESLDGYRGTVGEDVIVRMWFPSESWSEAFRLEASQQTVARVSLDVSIRYRDMTIGTGGGITPSSVRAFYTKAEIDEMLSTFLQIE